MEIALPSKLNLSIFSSTADFDERTFASAGFERFESLRFKTDIDDDVDEADEAAIDDDDGDELVTPTSAAVGEPAIREVNDIDLFTIGDSALKNQKIKTSKTNKQ